MSLNLLMLLIYDMAIYKIIQITLLGKYCVKKKINIFFYYNVNIYLVNRY